MPAENSPRSKQESGSRPETTPGSGAEGGTVGSKVAEAAAQTEAPIPKTATAAPAEAAIPHTAPAATIAVDLAEETKKAAEEDIEGSSGPAPTAIVDPTETPTEETQTESAAAETGSALTTDSKAEEAEEEEEEDEDEEETRSSAGAKKHDLKEIAAKLHQELTKLKSKKTQPAITQEVSKENFIIFCNNKSIRKDERALVRQFILNNQEILDLFEKHLNSEVDPANFKEVAMKLKEELAGKIDEEQAKEVFAYLDKKFQKFIKKNTDPNALKLETFLDTLNPKKTEDFFEKRGEKYFFGKRSIDASGKRHAKTEEMWYSVTFAEKTSSGEGAVKFSLENNNDRTLLAVVKDAKKITEQTKQPRLEIDECAKLPEVALKLHLFAISQGMQPLLNKKDGTFEAFEKFVQTTPDPTTANPEIEALKRIYNALKEKDRPSPAEQQMVVKELKQWFENKQHHGLSISGASSPSAPPPKI